ncbi:hypothetical protein GQ55_8G231900 [Panicum hallii var. hallii]|jgi:speckle-type POZ protein|uniref:BTB domain-containing protein n=2 Tax=Panicum hallii TaxID=206008 RepID=A0A2T7CQJ0_9POAL|nr:BTB/POZ and MATH domain-containing protein 2-like [Panicum hallii]PAN43418.1 hypothetical protein PAHAL_8G234600 [Panicum hallii]PUZ45533.1 hypothetical protein GQ55_8G231900 [Panicum hallii var. hallii]
MPSSAVLDAAAGRSSASTIAADMETGSHELTVRGYSGTKGRGVGKCITSAPPFQAGGHRWRIQYYPDGYDEESADWVSLFLLLVVDHGARSNGSNGNVEAVFRFSLLDRTGQAVPSYTLTSKKQDFSTPKSHSWGWPKFIKRKKLEESPHFEDDTFRVSCHVTFHKIRTEESPAHFLPAPPTDLHRHLGDLLDSKVGADVKLRVGRETFTAHRSILAARSPVFRAELFGWMKEQRAAQVRIDDMEPRVFAAMLRFMYTDSLPEIDEGDRRVMAQHLLVAADRYRMERLKMICEDMLHNLIDTGTAATTLALAEQHGCHRLKERCINFLKYPGNAMAVMATDGFDHLMSSCPSLIKDLLAKVSP